MLSPKEFLIQECENVRAVISECLRHEYAGNRSPKIFQECQDRLESIGKKVDKQSDKDLSQLQELSNSLSRLSGLIARVERSKLGEFSWAFSAELERIAAATCQGISGADEYYREPLFAISAEGGLDAYGFLDEQNQVDIATHRVFNVVFPRSLKHHVLFHAILGHEIGHAALTVPSMIEEITRRVLSVFEEGPFEDAAAFRKWYEECGLGDLSTMADEHVEDMIDRWIDECFCDLFGLVLFGPSFVASSYSLLHALDPHGLEAGDDHPPNVVRFDLLAKAIAHLGWNKAPKAFWTNVGASLPHIPKWAKIISKKQVSKALAELRKILAPFAGVLYKPIKPTELERLAKALARAVPPTNSIVTAAGSVRLRPMDFRSVLFAGWLCWYRRDNPRLTFLELNQLCDQALLQQQGVDLCLRKSGGR